MKNDFYWLGWQIASITSRGIGDYDSGSKIWPLASVAENAQIGRNVMIGMYAHIGKNVIVGDGCRIQNGAQLFEGVTLEDDVFIGPHAVFTNVLTPRAFQKATEFKRTLVKRGASIGANSTILCGITIGEYAQVGAGTVVTKNVEPYTRVIGVPARATCRVCKCGEALPQIVLGNMSQFDETLTLPCKTCGKQYNYVPRNGVMSERIPDAP